LSFTSILGGLYSTLKTAGLIGNNPTVYSFSNITASISHPSTGAISTNNNGIGSLGISMLTERTTHDISADGGIFILKVDGNNGIVNLQVQQTSELHRWLLQLAGFLMTPTIDHSTWAEINMSIQDNNMTTLYNCTGGSLLKIPDLTFSAQGQSVTWIIYFADITLTTTSASTDLSNIQGVIRSIL
jgi:hypothetical protein